MVTRVAKSIAKRVLVVSSCVLSLAGCAGGAGNIALGPDAVKGKTVDATIDMREVQAAYIGSGSAGTGVLSFRGKDYPFQVGGVGVGCAGPSADRRGLLMAVMTSPRE